MNKSLLLILGILAILIISGCTQTGQFTDQPTCNPPYIINGDDCCLDQNDNNICDEDEVPQISTDDISCEPDYINAGSDFLQNTFIMERVDACKKACFDSYEVSSYRLEEDACSCDVNDCGTIFISYCGDGRCSDEESCGVCLDDCGKCPPAIIVNENELEASGNFELKEINGVKHFVAYKSKMGINYEYYSHSITVPIIFSYDAENIIKGDVHCRSSLTHGLSSMTSNYVENNAIVIFTCGSGCDAVYFEEDEFKLPIGIKKAYKNGNAEAHVNLYFKPRYAVNNEILSCSLSINVEKPPQKEITVDFYPILIIDDTI